MTPHGCLSIDEVIHLRLRCANSYYAVAENGQYEMLQRFTGDFVQYQYRYTVYL